MNATNRYLDAVKIKAGVTSDYAIAGKLKLTRSAISAYRTKNVQFDEEVCLEVASILDIDPMVILAEIHAEKAKSEQSKAVWNGLLEKLTGLAAMMLLVTGLTALQPAPAMASQVLKNSHDIYIMRNIRFYRRMSKGIKKTLYFWLNFRWQFA